MTTQIYKTNGDLLTTIADYDLDTLSCSITLLGKGVVNNSSIYEGNVIKTLENFCNTTSPNYPLEGQLWYQNFSTNSSGSYVDIKKLKYYTNDSTMGSGGWVQIADQYDIDNLSQQISSLTSEVGDNLGNLKTELESEIQKNYDTLNGQLQTEITRATTEENKKVNRAGDLGITGILRSTLLNVNTDGTINISPAYQTTTTNTLVEIYAQDHSSVGDGEQAVVHVDSDKYGNKYWYFDISTGNIITPNGTLATTNSIQSLFPKGSIILWFGISSSVPTGWAICDGTNGTPNLTNCVAMGADSDANLGTTVGSEYSLTSTDAHVLTVDELPPHTHNYGYRWWSDSGSDTGHTIVSTINDSQWPTTSTGSGQGHTHGLTQVSTIQPSVKLYYIMKII